LKVIFFILFFFNLIFERRYLSLSFSFWEGTETTRTHMLNCRMFFSHGRKNIWIFKITLLYLPICMHLIWVYIYISTLSQFWLFPIFIKLLCSFRT
jgi:hypothetical protein